MTITYPLPLSFWDDFPGWSTEFELFWRQEQSRTAGGATIVKDIGDPLWRMTAQSRVMKPNELDYWRARLASLENGLKTFRAFPKSRCFPIAYPNGSWPTGASFSGTAQLATVNANRKAIAVGGLPSGYKASVGDFLQIGTRDLHQVMEPATAAGGGATSQFEVRPHLWPGVVAGVQVLVKQPSCIMSIVPGSVSTTADLATGRGSVSFQALEAR
ncbi:hypothetical protein M0654_03735 [Rhizobium sp. NTR19]|uniref:Uncharacterized protein n=1 Tax=Neorhizobium turbinariae TaxID=2937795 RepID=A0ABT0IML5_9HYPH|nr:hypothetical protein [Neorhizobium turbinariae]MCK8779091.1 hypothetical protein [Neorhizobium turbinariae]